MTDIIFDSSAASLDFILWFHLRVSVNWFLDRVCRSCIGYKVSSVLEAQLVFRTYPINYLNLIR